ncbi:MAG: amidase [Bryobacteraceae bacterium]|nr:amidase [Bryobacteraceae bacterium]
MAQFGEDIFFSTIAELNARLKKREFSARELAAAFCDRLEKTGPKYNALALSLRDLAMRKAADVDDDLRRERFRGPLQGIPFAVKDLLTVAGKPTTWGAEPYAGQVFDYDATVIDKLEGAGAVLTGKLAMVELAGGGGYRYPSASMTGPGLNPWDVTRWSGGSSSGSGAAVAAGLTVFAIGSETSGSIMTPAAFCGVTGLRPTYGYVSRYGAMALSWTMDKIGTLCRSAEDCGLTLQEISGGDGKDPGSAGKRFYYAPQFVRKFADLTVGYAPSDFEESAAESSRPALREAWRVIKDMGFRLKEVELPDFPYGAVTGTIIRAEGSAVFEPLIAGGQVDRLADKDQIAGLKAGLEIPAKDYLRAMRIRRLIQDEFRKLFVDVNVLVTPSRFGPASKVEERLGGAGDAKPKSRGLRDLIPAGNLAGLPALSLPCGFDGGLPLGISLVGRPFYENTLLAVGREFQQATDWHRRRPPATT